MLDAEVEALSHLCKERVGLDLGGLLECRPDVANLIAAVHQVLELERRRALFEPSSSVGVGPRSTFVGDVAQAAGK